MNHIMTNTVVTMSKLTRRSMLNLLVALPVMAALSDASFAQTIPRKIAFIGAGRMAIAIGPLFLKNGYEVMFSSRHPEELKSLVDSLGPRAHAGTVAYAVQFGDVVVLTVPYTAMPDLAKEHGKALVAKPLVIDVSNPVANRDGEIGATAREQGAGHYLVGLMPGLKVVRVFNAMNYAKLPEYATRTGEKKVAAPMVGDDPKATALAQTLIRQIGFEPVMIGGLNMSRHTAPREPLADDHTVPEAHKIIEGLK